MSRDIEKEMRSLRDSVNSGLIDDELSRIVNNTRASYAKTGRQELKDEDVEELAAAAHIGGGGTRGDVLGELYKTIQDMLDVPDNYQWKKPAFDLEEKKRT